MTKKHVNKSAITSSEGSGNVGSIAAGGRYDNLVGMFDPKGNSVPCVGVSIGVERIFSALEAKHAAEDKKLRTKHVDVYVVSAHKGLYEERLKIVTDLWTAGIRTEHSFRLNPKLLKQFQYCEKYNIPFAVVFGESELEQGVVLLRDVQSRKEVTVPLASLVEEIRKRI